MSAILAKKRAPPRSKGRGTVGPMGHGMKKTASVLGALALAAVSLTGASTAKAQTNEELAKAKELFMEGVALASGNNCAGAIAKYKEVARVKMTPQVAFNIAECEERLGKLVSALGNYRLVQSQLEDPKVKKKA